MSKYSLGYLMAAQEKAIKDFTRKVIDAEEHQMTLSMVYFHAGRLRISKEEATVHAPLEYVEYWKSFA